MFHADLAACWIGGRQAEFPRLMDSPALASFDRRLLHQAVSRQCKFFACAGLSTAVAMALAGCAASKTGKDGDRAHVSSILKQRTGQTIRVADPPCFKLPPGIELADGISEEEAVSIALWNNAGFQQSLAALQTARGDLAQAGMLSNPTLSILFPLGPKQLEFAANLPVEALWLRPRRLAIASLDAQRIAKNLIQNGLNLMRDVRAGFSDLELARDRARLSGEAAVVHRLIVALVEARRRAGEASALETEAAQIELKRAQEEEKRFNQDISVAKERLLYLMGWNDGSEKVVFNPLSTESEWASPLPELEKHALASRPDLRACELAVEAAAKRAGLAKAEIFTLTGIIDANGSGKEGFEIGPGALVSLPIFHQNQAGRVRAAADVERAAWNCIGAQQLIRLEVREAYAKRQQAEDSLRRLRQDLLPSLEGLANRSRKAYQLGDLSPLAVQESARQLIVGRMREAELAADFRRAEAELHRCVGTRLKQRPK